MKKLLFISLFLIYSFADDEKQIAPESKFERIKESKIIQKIAKKSENLLEIEAHGENYILPLTFSLAKRDKNPETKFQISIKHEMLHEIFDTRASAYFAYTQLSWWQIAEDSAPFRETNYMPEIFLNLPLHAWNLNKIRMGVLHHSNGRGGAESRSWNRVYLQGLFGFDEFSLATRIWTRIGEASDNRDIVKFAGQSDIIASYALGRQIWQIKANNNFRKNNKGSVEFDWFFPVVGKIYGYAQYFSGYAESLIDYDRRTNRAGVGFLIAR